MNRSAFPIRIVGAVGVVLLLALIVGGPVGALSPLYQQEPTPRPTATAAPYIELNPDQGVAGNNNQTEVTGYFFIPHQPLRFLFDATLMEGLSPIEWRPDGTFAVRLRIPPQAQASLHRITAEQAGGVSAFAWYTLVEPTPTNTPLPTNTWTPSPTRSPTLTPSVTPTASPSPTLRPITPMVTITPIPPTRPPVRATSTPRPTRTNTPRPGTPTDTPMPTATLRPGQASPTPSPTPTPEEEIADTGGGWGTVFLWGFVLAGLLVVFRLLRVRGLGEQS
jgi:hypothetical protein